MCIVYVVDELLCVLIPPRPEMRGEILVLSPSNTVLAILRIHSGIFRHLTPQGNCHQLSPLTTVNQGWICWFMYINVTHYCILNEANDTNTLTKI